MTRKFIIAFLDSCLSTCRLAAVDVHTASHIYEHALCGELQKGKTTILVTHQVTLCLSRATYVLELREGRIIKQGEPSQFSARNSVSSFSANKDKPEDQDMATEHSTVEDGLLGEAESRAEGRVSLSTYLLYVRAAGRIIWIMTFMFMLLIRAIALLEQVCFRIRANYKPQQSI